jgi:hypothetical protein
MKSRFLSALLLTSFLSVPAHAEQALSRDGWHTGIMREQDGKFAYCVTGAEFPNGKSVMLALNPAGQVNIGLGQAGGQMTVGERRPVAIAIDDQGSEFPGRVTKPELIVVNTAADSNILHQIANGERITIDGNSFSLAGSGRAIAELSECVQVSSARQARNAVPSPQQQSAPAEPQIALQQPAPVAPDSMPQVQFDEQPVAMPGERSVAATPPLAAAQPPSVPAEFAEAPPSIPVPSERNTETSMASAPMVEDVPVPPSQSADSGNPAPETAIQNLIERVAQEQPELPPVEEATSVEVLAPPASVQPPTAQPAETLAEAATTAIAPRQNAEPRQIPAQLKRLLENAGVKNIAPKETTLSGEVFAWTGSGLNGSVHEAAASRELTLDQMARRHILRLSEICDSNQFASKVGAPETAGALQLLPASFSCGDSYTTLVFSLSRNGILSVISHDKQGRDHGSADTVQSGILKALRDTQG